MIQIPPINPVALQLGPLKVHWYGVMYGLGFILTYFIVKAQVKHRELELTDSDIADFIMYLIMGVIFGGRLGYILFYNLQDYVAHPLEIFAVWHGGMSFHGGLIGTIVAGWLFCRKFKLKFLELADIVMVAVPLGLGLGRIGNFINGELWGRQTDAPWGMIFQHAPLVNGMQVARHPSQLYEAGLEGLVLFLLIYLLSRFRPRPGTLLGVFLMGYGVIRFSLEFLREPDQQLGMLFGGALSMGQLLSIPMVVGGLALVLWAYLRRPTPDALSESGPSEALPPA